MRVEFLPLSGAMLIMPDVYEDERGYMMETYKNDLYIKFGIYVPFVLDYYSHSKKGVLRGLHFQLANESTKMQEKLVTVFNGVIYDVLVDLRHDSPTFGKWYGTILSGINHHELWIPAGIAHGFYVLSDWSDMLYKFTAPRIPEAERTLLWNDPDVGIDWHMEDQKPILSRRDKDGKLFKQLLDDEGKFV